MAITKHAPRIDPEEDVDVIFEEDVDFGRYVVLIWRWLPLVVSVALLCGAIASLITLVRPTQYEAASTLGVSGSKIGEQAPSIAAVNYRPFIENNSVAAMVVKEFQLGNAPYHLSPELFLGSVLSVEEVRNSNLIRLRVTLPDPALAADVANRVSDLAVEGARKLSQAEAVQARDDLRAEVDNSRKQMENAAARLESFKATAQVELSREDVKAVLEQRGQLLPLLVAIEGARAKVARGEAELAGRQRVDSFAKGSDTDPTRAQEARTTGTSEGSLLSLLVEQQLAKDRAELAALESRRSELIGVRRLDRQQQATLTALYRKESELARLTADYEVAEKSYKEIAARFDVAKVQVASRSGQIQVIDRAIVPTVRKPRHLARNAVFGLVAGATIAAVGLVLAAAVRDALTRAKAA